MDKNIPSPKDLLSEAREQFVTPDLSSYTEVIMTLRDKGMTWRAIADWLSARGVKCTHNEIYYLGRRHAEIEAEREAMIQEMGLEEVLTPAERARRKHAQEKEMEDSGESE